MPWALRAMALLVLLARPAPARVVTADLLVVGHAALLDVGHRLGLARGAGRRHRQRARRLADTAARVGHVARARARARGGPRPVLRDGRRWRRAVGRALDDDLDVE